MHIGAKIGAKKAVFCQNEETKKWQDRLELPLFFVKVLSC